jgi:undecaprenyl-diphosphatase
MDWLQTIIISIVEGLTEFLPVSSTGHMIITQALLGVESTDFVKAFTVNIQFGAILSVVFLYWKRFFKINRVDEEQYADQQGMKKIWTVFVIKYDFYVKLLVAFIPAAIIGFFAGDYIDSLLENVNVVAVMLFLG